MRLFNWISFCVLTSSVVLAKSSHHDSKPHQSNDEVSVFRLNQQNDHHSTPIVDTETALFYLADLLDISDFFKLKQESIEMIDDIYADRTSSAVEDKAKLYVTIHGVENARQLFDSDALFKFTSAEGKFKKTLRVAGDLNNKFLREFVDSHQQYQADELTHELKLISMANQSNDQLDHFKYFDEKLVEIWRNFKNDLTSRSEQQVVLGNDHINFVNDFSFIHGLSQLIHLSKVQIESTDSVFFETHALSSVGSKIGFDSSTYQFSTRVFGDYLKTLSSKFDVVVLAYPSNSRATHHDGDDDEELTEFLTRQQHSLAKRDSELKQIFETYGKRSNGVQSAASCFTNEEACQVGTSNCQSHGVCTKVNSNCWQCLCSASFNKTTSKTTKWSGFDCGARDVSAQAHLLLWSSLALLVAFVGGVKLLADVGGESLPGVLDAAASSSKKNL